MTTTALDWPDEPTAAELAAIEAEWPVIAAEISLLDRLIEFDAVAALDDLDVSGVDFSLS